MRGDFSTWTIEKANVKSVKVRTYFWHERVISKSRLWLRRIMNRNPSRFFVTGNAGDIFNVDLVHHVFRGNTVNDPDEGRRLLTVGSIAHRAKGGDILCGVGLKTRESFPSDCSSADLLIYGLRGPLTYDVFKRNGYDVSHVRFLLDPGLLIRYMVSESERKEEGNRVIFVPHYRERFDYGRKIGREIHVINIDCEPLALATEILRAKMVYSSSLHGIVFAHALGRPCVFVKPKLGEPLFKYRDYFDSVSLGWRPPIDSIFAYDFRRDGGSPPDVRYGEQDFQFPSIAELVARGIAYE